MHLVVLFHLAYFVGHKKLLTVEILFKGEVGINLIRLLYPKFNTKKLCWYNFRQSFQVSSCFHQIYASWKHFCSKREGWRETLGQE